jgi:drug/metabolite transporter (DMT)-like permease
VAVLLIGWLSFGEVVSLLRWLGVILICVGIVAIYSEQFFLTRGYVFAGLMVGLAAVVGWTTTVADPTPIFDKPVGLIAMSITLGILGQFLFKAGMNRPEYRDQISAIGAALRPGERRSMAGAVGQVLHLFVRPFVVAGVVCYGVSTISWLAILGRTPLSFVYPLISIGYVAILLMGWLLFHERVTALRWYGVVLICYGIVTIFSEELVHAHSLAFAGGLVLLAAILGVASRATRAVGAAG